MSLFFLTSVDTGAGRIFFETGIRSPTKVCPFVDKGVSVVRARPGISLDVRK